MNGYAVLKGTNPSRPVSGEANSSVWFTPIGNPVNGFGPVISGSESDPNGKSAHEPGSKLDAGKVRPALVLGGFARALLEVSKVGTYGAVKYTENGWMEVPNGEARYDDAKLRHWLKEKAGEASDPDTELVHAAHEAWNALARLDLMIRKREA